MLKWTQTMLHGAQSNLHKSSTNPSTTHRSSGCAVIHVSRVSIGICQSMTHSTLDGNFMCDFVQATACSSRLDDSSFCGTPSANYALPLSLSATMSSGRLPCCIRRKVPSSSNQTTAGTRCSTRMGLEARRGRSRCREHSKAQSLPRGQVGHIPHSDDEAELRATSSTISSMLHDGEAWNRTWG